MASNPDKGRVKRKLAKEVGDEQALGVYQKLLIYTKEITKKLNCDKSVFYSDRIDDNDLWDNMIYTKNLQSGDNRGERLTDAFTRAFAMGKDRVVVIGTDCIELESYMIKEAFAVLESNDVVMGPSSDGGYYMLGMRKFLPMLLLEKDWNSDDLLMDTIIDLKKLDSKYYLLKTLNNIETSADLDQLSRVQQKPDDWF
ncbi:MAG: TIGR04282 family arsenosugar biosynthesis glycosyltransferase [Flavobacteriales bacterium]|nr:TIGR04282 family arsenosugar biosynthesis glycosyltransferase [Flavobacteriales bacterium]